MALGIELMGLDRLAFIFYIAVTAFFFWFWRRVASSGTESDLFAFRDEMICNEKDATARGLSGFWKTVQELAEKAGVRCSHLLVFKGEYAQAGVLNDAGEDLIAITERAIKILNPEELRAVIAYGLVRVKHGRREKYVMCALRTQSCVCLLFACGLLLVWIGQEAVSVLGVSAGDSSLIDLRYPFVSFWAAYLFLLPSLEAFVFRQEKKMADTRVALMASLDSFENAREILNGDTRAEEETNPLLRHLARELPSVQRSTAREPVVRANLCSDK